ncbi:MAG: four helix bundle protein [Candidatus Kapabacteria bacterium]|nr:four helix bundle protein [Candidatus Kapabacteria bacterium]
MALSSLRVYRAAAALSDLIAQEVQTWSHFDRTTLGHQMVRAADSISNNIAEGYGRVSTGERLQFYMYAKGSNTETLNCLERAYKRNLIPEEQYKSTARTCYEISIGLVELANSELQKNPSYRGPYRERIEKLRQSLISSRTARKKS